MTPFTCLIGLLPLALYFLYVSKLNWSRRTSILSGTKDNLLLACGLAGIVLVGPGQMLVPVGALVDKGSIAWLLLLMLYLLLVLFFSGFLRPRIVLYNTTEDAVRAMLNDLGTRNGLNVNWLGATADLPGLGIHFCLEKSIMCRNITLLATGRQSTPGGWQELESLLREAACTQPPERSFHVGRWFFALSVLLLTVLALLVAFYPAAIGEGFYRSF